jgi:hypothetical protein
MEWNSGRIWKCRHNYNRLLFQFQIIPQGMGPACTYSRSSRVNECMTLQHMKVKLSLGSTHPLQNSRSYKTFIIDPFYNDKTKRFITKNFIVPTNPNGLFTLIFLCLFYDASKWTNHIYFNVVIVGWLVKNELEMIGKEAVVGKKLTVPAFGLCGLSNTLISNWCTQR